jgi:tetratricopeptide (TPR) repeat protein
MEFLESIFDLSQKDFLPIIAALWIIFWLSTVLGIIICSVSALFNRRVFEHLRQKYIRHTQVRDQEPADFELDLESLKDTLILREAELRQDIERMGFDEELQAVLENFRHLIQKKWGDLSAAYSKRLEELKSIYRALDNFKEFFGGNQIAPIRTGLKRGETGKAKAGLIQVLAQVNRQLDEASGSQLAVARGKRLSAEVSYHLGRLAEIDFDYFMATHYYKQAAALQPANLTYLQAAVRLTFTACEFHDTEYMLKKILKTQQKLLGPEHPNLAQTLNNLGVLCHTQGRHAEAEAFYLWALEVCEANQNPLDPDIVYLMRNYTSLLKEVGRDWKPEVALAQAKMA